MNSDNEPKSWHEAAADHEIPATEPTPAEAIQAVQDARAATDEPRPLPRQGEGWSIRHGSADKTLCYPTAGSYTWGAFAGVAIESGGKPIAAVEMGGYCDLEMIDPYTLQRLWVADLMRDENVSIYDALRALIDVAEREQFLG